jgi:hypothetical protein
MIPNVFVSSTIEDLQHLREAVRDVIVELGYVPVMSEYGGIGYLPTATAQESCYIGVANCHIAVVIVGKRYGSIANGGVSVTQNEYRKARDCKIPIFCVIAQEVLTFKKVHDAQNADNKPSFPGMDDAPKTFAFMDEIVASPVNNGFMAYSSVADVRGLLKAQVAHLVGELLRSKVDPLRSGLDDVLSEVKTLRHEVAQKFKSEPSTAFLRVIRFLIDEENKQYTDLVKWLYETVDAGVPTLIKAQTFDDFVQMSGGKLQMITAGDVEKGFDKLVERGAVSSHSFWVRGGGKAECTFFRGKHIEMTESAKGFFEELHTKLRQLL